MRLAPHPSTITNNGGTTGCMRIAAATYGMSFAVAGGTPPKQAVTFDYWDGSDGVDMATGQGHPHRGDHRFAELTPRRGGGATLTPAVQTGSVASAADGRRAEERDPAMPMTRRRRTKLIVVSALAVVVAFGSIWASDQITLQGERTIFTVTCQDGAWTGTKCSGRLAAGPRYAFRSSKLRQEVIYWVRGTTEPSNTYANCEVVDRDNWTCRAAADQKPTVAFEMKNGRLTRTKDGSAIPFHDVPKWKWWLIRSGLPVFSQALS
jgi:hypothetical protein